MILIAAQRAWATLCRSWDQWSFKPATFAYANEPCLSAQGFCPMKGRVHFSLKQEDFSLRSGSIKEDEPRNLSSLLVPRPNTIKCTVHVLAHVMAQ